WPSALIPIHPQPRRQPRHTHTLSSSAKTSPSAKATTSAELTNLVVLYAMHMTFMTCVTPKEWATLGEGSRTEASRRRGVRCTHMGGSWVGRIRWVDWLSFKTHPVDFGIDQSKMSA
ncbi:hypothetical protein EDB89DRAFT_1823102, partial [Lactarius sanguifluus]